MGHYDDCFEFDRQRKEKEEEARRAPRARQQGREFDSIEQIELEKKRIKEAVDLFNTKLVAPSPPVVGTKYDSGKDRWELLLEMASAEQAVKVLTYGANTKYSRGNYFHVKGWRWRYAGAASRHLKAYLCGEPNDKDTGYPHLAHAIASLLMLLDNEIKNAPDGDVEPERTT
jgi:hypothetical protein